MTNLPDTVHTAAIRFAAGGTINASEPHVATTPPGNCLCGLVNRGRDLDRLLLLPVLLPDLTTTKTQASSAGSVTVTGPVSCLPADDISVGVKGTPAKNWHVQQQSLKLGIGDGRAPTLSGASLTSRGAAYTLTGQVTFADGNVNKSVTAVLTFRRVPRALTPRAVCGPPRSTKTSDGTGLDRGGRCVDGCGLCSGVDIIAATAISQPRVRRPSRRVTSGSERQPRSPSAPESRTIWGSSRARARASIGSAPIVVNATSVRSLGPPTRHPPLLRASHSARSS